MNPTEQLPFFFYGTLRPRDYNYLIYLDGKTQKEEPGYTVPGFELFDFGPYPLARQNTAPGSFIVGDLIWFKPEIYAETLVAVDGLEGYDPNRAENMYYRAVREVQAPDGSKIQAYIYIVSEKYYEEVRPGLTRIPDGDWLKWIATRQSAG